MDERWQGIGLDDVGEGSRDLALVLADGRASLEEQVRRAVGDTPEPQRAARFLGRFLEGCAEPSEMLDKLTDEAGFAVLLCTLFTQSNFLSDLLFRNPDDALWLWEASLEEAHPLESMLEKLLGPEEGFDSFEACCAEMRRFRQREILRIAARDVVRHCGVPSVTEDLSNLADATLEAAIHGAWPELEARFGKPLHEDSEEEARFVVLAMGKLGGRELNFSSDVDLLFLYSAIGETTGGASPALSNTEFFKKLGEMIIKALSEQTSEGLIFRVDMRLRPFGESGPLAADLESSFEYYALYGRAWERQALLKARPCAGHLALGEAFLEELRPVIYPKFFDDATLDDIRQTKQRTEAHVLSKGNEEGQVKLGLGGIRDIEFTVQMLQLLNGGQRPELRTANTLEAIDALGRCDVLSSFEASSLASNYVFLRQVEHRLQIEDGRQAYLLPSSAEGLDLFAKRLGYQDRSAFLRVYTERREENRSILERFLAGSGGGHLWVGDLLDPSSPGEAGLEKLGELGFQRPEEARRELLELATSDSTNLFVRHVHEQFTAIAPGLIKEIAACPHPDATLLRLSQVLENMKAPATLYELLKTAPPLVTYLIQLTDNSDYLSRILIRDPGLFDIFSVVHALDRAVPRTSLEESLAGLLEAVDDHASLYRLRDSETLRVALRDLARGISIAQVGDELTMLAEVILESALWQAREKTTKRFGETDISFAILALGKFGGWEMGYGSDLDLIFVYEGEREIASGVAPAAYFTDVASRTLKILKEPTRHGILYDIDARLRPDGSKGMLAIDHNHFADYFHNEAQPWERHALMKARAVAGERGFGASMEKRAKEIAFGVHLDKAELDDFENLRQKAIAHAGSLDLKKGAGGMADIEFATRFLQLSFCAEFPELRRGDVFGALDILRDYELVDPLALKTLRQAYGDLRRILNRMRMMDGGGGSTLPDTEEGRRDLASRLGIEDDLLDYVRERRAKVNEVYQHTLQVMQYGAK
jgi:[glutamine synthetase] adenylyltransferase / [glutamine synthetase]-adenylyl-L-tyrosine phosphorylase